MGLVLLITLHYAKNVLKVTAKKWDLDMITASDYTVTYDISKAEYDDFKREFNDPDDSPAIGFMKHLKSRFEELVSKKKHVLYETTDIVVANISFSFNNHEMIRLLSKRGTAIIYQDFTEKDKVERDIEILKDKKFDEMTRPNIAYITFETQEGYERAIKIRPGLIRTFKPAVEPTNIIWENSHFSLTHIIWRSVLVISAIVILLLLSFLLFFYLKIGLADTNRKYMNLNCESFNNNVGTADTKLRYAMIDYYDYYHSTTGTMMSGALQ
jgi:RNA recognition motif-containing protein